MEDKQPWRLYQHPTVVERILQQNSTWRTETTQRKAVKFVEKGWVEQCAKERFLLENINISSTKVEYLSTTIDCI